MSNIDPIPRQHKDEFISIKDLWYLSLYHWPWFAISLVLCLSAGIYYLKTTSKVYLREASVLIKQEGKGNSTMRDQSEEFSDIGFLLNKTNIYNEQRHLQSLDILMEVSRQLSLNVRYTLRQSLLDQPLYGAQLPFEVVFPEGSEDLQGGFDIFVSEYGGFTLSDFLIDGIEQHAESVTLTLDGEPKTTPLGLLSIRRNSPTAQSLVGEIVHVSHTSLLSAANSIRSNLKLKISEDKSTIIDLEYRDVSIRRAEDVLNSIVSVYNQKGVNDKQQLMRSTSQFIDERLRLIEQELSTVDSDISNFKSAHGITDIQAASNLYLDQYSHSDAEILRLNNQLSIAQYIRDFLTDKKKSHTLLPANSGLSNTSIQSQIQSYNTQLLQLNSHLSYTSAQNPLIGNMESQLTAQREGVMQSLNNEIEALSLQLSSYEQYSGDASAKIESNPDQAKYLLSVERQQKVKESLYLYLLQKREENDLSQSFVTFNGQLLDMPHGAPTPVSPNGRNIIFAAFFLGLLIPLVVVFVQENMNGSVRGRQDLEGRVTMPLLGEVPLYIEPSKAKLLRFNRKYRHAVREILVKPDNRNMLNEAFRVIRTNIEFMTASLSSGQGTVFTIVSYQPDSGKTFISSNLGAALSIMNHRVLLIDGDLRHASLSAYIQSTERGISDYLGSCIQDIHEVIVPHPDFSSLDILPVGSIPPNPTELLSNPRFSQLIQQLRNEYEYILIDCPPADLIADASIIEQYSDRTIFVLRIGLFDREMLETLENDYKDNRYHQLSLILNGSTSGRRYNSRYRYAYSSYAYIKPK